MKAEKVSPILKTKNLTLSCAESCTGGLLSHLLTGVSGSSVYFKGTVVCYSPEAKRKILKIPAKTLKTKGTVSKETSLLLARNVRKLFRTDMGVSITGIAGPKTDPRNTPLGTVFIVISTRKKTSVHKFKFKGTRNAIKRLAAEKALDLIFKEAKKLPPGKRK